LADTKVSGLTAAASFLATHEIPVNEAGTSKKVTGTQIQATLAQGTLASGYAQITVSSATFTTIVDITGLTVSVTPGVSRRIRVSVFCGLTSSVNTDTITVYIFEGATQLAACTYSLASAFGHGTAYFATILTPTNAAHTYKVSAIRSAGSGNCQIEAAATNPAYIMAEDVGT
jgi:hypothetical protein